jgi:hypothetical protein
MSGSDRGSTDKNRLIQACIIAFFFIGMFSGWGYWFQSGYYQQAADKSAQYQGWADDEIRQRCGNRPDIFREKCERKINQTAHENKRNEYDLYAQRTSALWAGIMAIAALFGIGLSGVGVWLVKTTFDETRKANSIAKETLFRQLRAYVTVESLVDVNMTGGMSITLHNSGATPASGVKVVYDKLQVSDGVLSYVKTGIEVADIGAQARKSITLEWYNWSDMFEAKLKNPEVLVGSLIYRPVVPDEKGCNRELVEQFRIEKSDSEHKGDLKVEITRLPPNTRFA